MDSSCDSAHHLSVRRQARETQSNLSNGVAIYNHRIKMCEAREKHFMKTDLELQQKIINFNANCQQNDIKMNRARHKYISSKIKVDVEEKQCDDLTKLLYNLQRNEETLEAKLDKFKKYYEYLSQVVKYGSDFPGVQELLKRFNIIVKSNSALVERITEQDNGCEDMKVAMKEYVNEKANRTLYKNNDIVSLQNQLDATRTKGDNLAQRQSHQRSEDDGTVELLSILESVDSLLQRFHNQQGSQQQLPSTHIWASHPYSSKEHIDLVHSNLERLSDYLIDYGEIVSEVQYLQHNQSNRMH